MSRKIILLLILIPLMSFYINLSFAQKLKVLTYNVHHCNPPSQKGIIDVDTIAGIIRGTKADIVFLQEIDYKSIRVGGIDQPQVLSNKSGLPNYRFFKAIDIPGGEYGIMILSRFPIVSSKKTMLAAIEGGEQRVIGIVSVKLNDNSVIYLACTHLDLSKDIREVQVRQIDSLLSRLNEDVIIGGDFNAAPDSPEIQFMRQRYNSSTDIFLETFPNLNPSICIDYIFMGKKTMKKFLTHKVLQDIDGSDHLPLLVEIQP